MAEAKGENFAVVGRLEYDGLDFLNVGLSGYSGGVAQGNTDLGNAGVTIAEGDIRYQAWGFELTGLFAAINLDDADKIATVTGQDMGKNMQGWTLEGAYHLGRLFLPSGQDLVPFVRQEQFNTQVDMPSGLTASKANDRQITTVGLAYVPSYQTAVKVDFENWSNQAGGSWQQWNAGMAVAF